MRYDFDAVCKRLEEILAIPSPAGHTFACRDRVREICEAMGLTCHLTHKGALYALWEGETAEPARVITAHIDTLGGMVSEILPNGRLRFACLGGFAYGCVEAESCLIMTDEQGMYTGTVLPDKASVHIYSDDVRNTPRLENNVQIRLDADVQSPADVEALGIRLGDFIAFEPHFVRVGGDYVKARYLDNKLDVALLLELVADMKKRGLKPRRHVWLNFSDFEEVGHGFYGLPKDVEANELVALDIGTVGAYHSSSEKTVTIVAKDSRTPYPYDFRRELSDLCRQGSIPFTVDVHYRYGSDASVNATQGGDFRFSCFGPGVDATHHMERSHREGIFATMALLEAWLLS